ncbi:MAG: T9SS type A sorting domain-containing protein, partial [Bacteroidota bacterium]
MKIQLLFLFLWCLLTGPLVWGQTNLITNSQLEISNCGDSGPGCPNFGNCLPGWTISHGTPNYIETKCDGPSGFDFPDHHIQMIFRETKSEGVYTDIDLDPGCHRLFVRVKMDTNNSTNLNANLRISLDHNLNSIYDPFACQQPIPSTTNTDLIYNNSVIFSGIWYWVIVDFEITEETDFLDQLMITGLTNDDSGVQAIVWIDCIYLYRNCTANESLNFAAPVNSNFNIANGTYESCSDINSQTPIPSTGSVNVPQGANVVFKAFDYIRLRPNFRAQNNFRAHIDQACSSNTLGNFQPDCCEPFRPGDGGKKEVDPGDGTTKSQKLFDPVVFPNPATTQFEVNLPDGIHEIRVYDLMGSVLHQQEYEFNASIDAANWKRGVYFI